MWPSEQYLHRSDGEVVNGGSTSGFTEQSTEPSLDEQATYHEQETDQKVAATHPRHYCNLYFRPVGHHSSFILLS